jgi:hypothetical protein
MTSVYMQTWNVEGALEINVAVEAPKTRLEALDRFEGFLCPLFRFTIA